MVTDRITFPAFFFKAVCYLQISFFRLVFTIGCPEISLGRFLTLERNTEATGSVASVREISFLIFKAEPFFNRIDILSSAMAAIRLSAFMTGII